MQRVYVVNIGTLPDPVRHPIKRYMAEKVLSDTPGLLDWCATKEHGTLLIFATLAHAQKSQDAMRKSGNPVEDKIYVAFADREEKSFRIINEIEGA